MAAKKKKKKASSKKKTASKPANPLTLALYVSPLFSVGTEKAYQVMAKGNGAAKVELGHVTAKGEAEAKRKARSLLKRLL